MGIGTLARYDVESLRSTVGQMQDRQNKLVTKMESLTTDTAKLVKNFKKLQGAVDMMKNLEVSTSHFLKIEIAIQQVAVMAKPYFSGLSSLMDGKLNVDMVSAAVASEEFTKVKEAAFSGDCVSGFHPTIPAPGFLCGGGGPDQCDCGCSLDSYDRVWEIYYVPSQLFVILFE